MEEKLEDLKREYANTKWWQFIKRDRLKGEIFHMRKILWLRSRPYFLRDTPDPSIPPTPIN